MPKLARQLDLSLRHVEASEMTENSLVGTWQTDVRGKAAINAYGNVTLKFETDGTLRYTVHEDGRDEVILLTYRVESGFIITNQPSHPSPEQTAYEITPDGRLILNLGGQKSFYYRASAD